jgi:hypothetical protein
MFLLDSYSIETEKSLSNAGLQLSILTYKDLPQVIRNYAAISSPIDSEPETMESHCFCKQIIQE